MFQQAAPDHNSLLDLDIFLCLPPSPHRDGCGKALREIRSGHPRRARCEARADASRCTRWLGRLSAGDGNVSSFVVVASVREGTRERARALIEQGPPYDLAATGLTAHTIHLTEREVVFVFEGEDARGDVERIISQPELWHAAKDWRDVLAGRPRLAKEIFAWSRDAHSRAAR
jgi:hypothetical protein